MPGSAGNDLARELKAESRGSKKAAAEEAAVLATIAEMAPGDRALAERVHAVVLSAAPELAPKLWYGQPAYSRAGKVVCFFRSGQVDKERYSSFGFSVEANLDEAGGDVADVVRADGAERGGRGGPSGPRQQSRELTAGHLRQDVEVR